MYVILESNASMVCLKMNDNKKAIEHSDKGLSYDENHIKCLARKAQALLVMGNYEQSQDLIKKCLTIDPKNQYCQMISAQCAKQIKLYKQKRKNIAKKMFG